MADIKLESVTFQQQSLIEKYFLFKSKQKLDGKLLLSLRLQFINFPMTQTLRNIINRSPTTLTKPKVGTLITALHSNTINKSFQFDSMSQNSLDNLELLKLEVDQLKRQNTFLKRKIQELNVGKTQAKVLGQKKQSLNCLHVLKKNALLEVKNNKNNNSLTFIFAQIQNILKSLASIHRLQIDQNLWIKNQSSEYLNSKPKSQQETNFIKQCQQMKQKMNKKLQMIALQKEQIRYNSLLEVFSEFYQAKTQEENKRKQQIQKYIESTLQIGKKLIEKACNKSTSRSMKSSSMYSVKKRFDEVSSPGASIDKQNFGGISLRINFQRNQVFHSTIQHGKALKQIDKQNPYY